MGPEILIFGYIEIEKNSFYSQKSLTRFFLVRENYKYFIGYLYNNHKVRTLHLMLPKTSAYVKSYDGLLEKYNIIWDKVSADIKKKN